MRISETSKVELHFDVRLKDGSIAESTKNVGKPMDFTMGDGSFSAKMEAELLGLNAGDNKKIMLLAKDAFGDPHPANIFQLPIARFEDMELELGTIVSFSQADGSERPGIVRAIADGDVTVDFNHPLAGQVLLFDVTIVSVS